MALSPTDLTDLAGRATLPPTEGWGRRLMRGAMAVFYGVAGVVHLSSPAAFLPIMPAVIPFPEAVIVVTGVCEIAGAFGLLTRRWRWWAGVMLAVYAVAVFPANLKHAFLGVNVPQLPSSWWYHGPRLLAQPILVWWALFAGGVTGWPFRRAGQGAEKR